MKIFDRVYLEITNSCNLSCSFCAINNRPKSIISIEQIDDILKQLSGITKTVSPHILGEPLSHPDFNQFISLCGKYSINVNLTTNGTIIETLDPDNADSVITQINFSVHSLIDADIYKETLPDILGFCSKISAMKNIPYINFRFWDMNSDSIDDEYSIKSRDAIKMILNYYQIPSDTNLNSVDVKSFRSIKLAEKVYLNFNSRFKWPDINDEVISSSGFCHALSTHFGILSDGKIIPCCLDSEGILSLGNIFDNNILSALNSDKSKRMSAQFDTRKLSEELCQKCSYIKRFSKK